MSRPTNRPAVGRYVYTYELITDNDDYDSTSEVARDYREPQPVTGGLEYFVAEDKKIRRIRWGNDSVALVASGREGAPCIYDPPMIVVRLPITVGRYPEQRIKGSADCSWHGADLFVHTEVLGSETLTAAGKTWIMWRIVTDRKAARDPADPGIGSEHEVSLFSPELGVDVMTDVTTQVSTVRYREVYTIKNYPQPNG